MSRDNHHRAKNRGSWNSKNTENSNNSQNSFSTSQNKSFRHEKSRNFVPSRAVSNAEIQKQNEEIKAFKANVVNCKFCGEPINDLASAINDQESGSPVHFDCVIKKLSERETLTPNDKVTYIGNGKFAILHFENVHDMRHFSIVKEIEWEARDAKRGEWRDTMAGLYSQVK